MHLIKKFKVIRDLIFLHKDLEKNLIAIKKLFGNDRPKFNTRDPGSYQPSSTSLLILPYMLIFILSYMPTLYLFRLV